jgi:hypothetical protein
MVNLVSLALPEEPGLPKINFPEVQMVLVVVPVVALAVVVAFLEMVPSPRITATVFNLRMVFLF